MKAPLELAKEVLAAQPFSMLLGTEVSVISADGVELRLPIRDDLKQQYGFLHGGAVAYLADNAMTFAGGYTMGGMVVTSEMKINYIRPAIGELIIARATTISAGKSQAVARCEIYAVKDGEERLCAAAQGTIVAASSEPARESK